MCGPPVGVKEVAQDEERLQMSMRCKGPPKASMAQRSMRRAELLFERHALFRRKIQYISSASLGTYHICRNY